MMKLWHSKYSRSLRVLWALEEMQLHYDLQIVPFPPRVKQKEFLALNELGTLPYFTDGNARMTESTAICHYLVEKYDQADFAIDKNHNDYGNFLNWLYKSDATLTFPQTLYLRYTKLEPEERQQPQVAEDYRIWFHARLLRLNEDIKDREFLVGDRFTIADIAVGYALYLGHMLGLANDYTPQTRAYLDRLTQRESFITANQR